MYLKIWVKPNHNCPEKKSLNKELIKKSRNLSEERKKAFAIKRVTYAMKLRSGTNNEMSQEEFEKRVANLVGRKLKVELTQVLKVT